VNLSGGGGLLSPTQKVKLSCERRLSPVPFDVRFSGAIAPDQQGAFDEISFAAGLASPSVEGTGLEQTPI
jgi:hypothetical protein